MADQNENALKHRYGRELLKKMAKSLSAVYPDFPSQKFISLSKKLSKLEMKQRVYLIRDELKLSLPENYSKALSILLDSIEKGKMQGFILWPYTEYIQTFGLDSPEKSLRALKEITKHFTSEWGVRPFLRLYPQETLDFLLECASDKNVHIRRWASEGARPRLPWGERLNLLIKEPKKTLPILSKLKFDDELYVRRSVANHLNDITKDHPQLVVETLRKWQKSVKKETEKKKIDWIVKHALRTLIKRGDPDALSLIGVNSEPKVIVEALALNQNKIKMGERLIFNFKLRSTSSHPQKIVVDYIVHFAKANNTRALKVFKLKMLELQAFDTVIINKKHHFKLITTRVYYPGVHILEIQINGKVKAKKKWVLTD